MFEQSENVSSTTVDLKFKTENGAFEHDDNICDEASKYKTGSIDLRKEIDQEIQNVWQNIKIGDESYADTSDEWSDIFKTDFKCLDQLESYNAPQKATNNESNVIELPQFILVFTALKVENTIIIPPNDLLPEYMHMASECSSEDKSRQDYLKKREIIKKHKALINRKQMKCNESVTKTDEINKAAPKTVQRIKYVRYSPPKDVVQRERGVQVPNKGKTQEVSVQCNLDEESEAITENDSQLEWINHILGAHVINDTGDMYECHICGEIAFTYASKERHSLIHKERSCLCSQCGLHFRTADKLSRHEKIAHQTNGLNIRKALRCPKLYCTKAFHSQKQLFNHIDGHTKKTEQRCNKCQRSFYSLFQYHIHKSKRNCWR